MLEMDLASHVQPISRPLALLMVFCNACCIHLSHQQKFLPFTPLVIAFLADEMVSSFEVS